MTSFIEAIINFFSSLFGGQKMNEQTAEQKTAEAPKMLMHEDVFMTMTSSESEATKERLRKEMAEKDQLGLDSYTISTENWIYTITRPKKGAVDYTDQYGTQFKATHK